MNKEQKTRLSSLLKKTGLVLGIGLGYAAFVMLTGWGIPCLFHKLTGLLCPGCGISRMFLSLLRGDLILAARYNLLVLALLPFGAALFLYRSFLYVRQGETPMRTWEKIFYCIAFLLCAAFTYLRNADLIPFLTLP